jgi:exosortase
LIYKNFPLKKYETQVGGLLVAAVFLFASWPIFLGLVQAWRGDDYSHGFFIIPGAIYLICKKKNGGKYPPPTGTWFGLFGIFIGLIFSMVGNLCGITTLANFAFVGTIWAILLFLKGYQFLIINKWELLMLVFMIPFPSGLYAQITNPLQLIATKTSCSFMQVIGMPVFAEGNLINLPICYHVLPIKMYGANCHC